MKAILFLGFIISFSSTAQTYFGKNWTLFNKENSQLATNYVEKMFEDGKGNYWFITYQERVDSVTWIDGYLQKFSNNQWTTYNHTNSPLTKNIVNDVAETKDGKLLIATSKGLYIKNNESWDSLNTSNSQLPHNFVYRITVDKLNRYWIGMENYGVALYSNGNWTLYNYQNSFHGIDDFNFIEVDSLNTVWIGTDFYGLYSFDGVNWKKRIEGGLNGTPLFQPKCGLAVDRFNQKWINIQKQGGQSRVAKSINDSSFIYYILSDLGFVTSLVSYDGVAIDKVGNKYFGTTDGLIKYDDVNWTRFNNSNAPIQGIWFRSGIVDSKDNKIYALATIYPPNQFYGVIFYNEDSVVVTSVKENNHTPGSYSLSQNYPNPFNPVTQIKYSIPASGAVQIKVYNILGTEIITLINEFKQAGNYTIDFDGIGLSSGIYFYKIHTGNYTETKKMMLLR